MFEFDQDAVDALLVDSAKFRHLYAKYSALKARISDGNARQAAIEPLDLEGLKKNKLQLKDRMAGMIKEFRDVPA